MSSLDWIVVAAYLIYVIWDGIRMTKHSTGVDGYYSPRQSFKSLRILRVLCVSAVRKS